MLGFYISLVVFQLGQANQDDPGYIGKVPDFLNSRAKWELGKSSTFTPLIEKILNEDWNKVNSQLFDGQIVEILGDIKKSKRIQINDKAIENLEKLIDTYTSKVETTGLANSTEGEKEEKVKTEELTKWAENALGEQGFNKSCNDLKKLVVGDGQEDTGCFFNCTKLYNGSIFENIAKRYVEIIFLKLVMVNK